MTIRNHLQGNELPEMEMFVTIVIGCGGQQEHQDALPHRLAEHTTGA
ncbi:MAG: hypothetical protein ACRDNF_15985 [Streptosporangiaceae bacterium]